jgi:ribosome maturation factor RimP
LFFLRSARAAHLEKEAIVTDKSTDIANLLSPTVSALGLELLGVEYLSAPGSAVVRLYIERPGAEGAADTQGVGIEDCEAVSREVSAQLDVEDPISGNYTLEVSSPGVDRLLFTAAHFARFLGEQAKVTLQLPQDGRRRLTGRISAVEGEAITFEVDGQPITVAAGNIDKARLVPDWVALGYGPAKDASGRDDRPGKGTPHNRQTNKPAATKPSRAE